MEFMLGLNVCVLIFSIITLIKVKALNKEYEKMFEENKKNYEQYIKKVNEYMYGDWKGGE